MILTEFAYSSIGEGLATYRTGVTYCGYTTNENVSVSQEVLSLNPWRKLGPHELLLYFMTESQWAQCCTGLLQVITCTQGSKSQHPFQVRGHCSCSMAHIIKFCNQDMPSYSQAARGPSDIKRISQVFFHRCGPALMSMGEGNASKIALNTSWEKRVWTQGTIYPTIQLTIQRKQLEEERVYFGSPLKGRYSLSWQRNHGIRSRELLT